MHPLSYILFICDKRRSHKSLLYYTYKLLLVLRYLHADAKRAREMFSNNRRMTGNGNDVGA